MTFCDLLGNPAPLGNIPEDKTVPKYINKYTFQRGGVGPGKGAKNALPTPVGKTNRLPINTRMF